MFYNFDNSEAQKLLTTQA